MSVGANHVGQSSASRLQCLAQLADARELSSVLNDTANSCGNSEPILLGVVANGRRLANTSDGVVNDASRHRFPLGCIAKLATATLLARLAGDPSEWAHRALPGLMQAVRLKLNQLLSHTHGLDDSHIEQAPRDSGNRIDTEALISRLTSVRPLADPGQHYSYSNAGAWLAAAHLEYITRQTYGDLFRQYLVAPLGLVSISKGDALRICPAGGGPTRLSIADALRFVEANLEDTSAASPLRALLATTWPCPGWSYAEQGICQGWKDYGAGWYGHDSRTQTAMSAVRIRPDLRFGFVFAGTGRRAFTTFCRLFARILPEFSRLTAPAVRTANELEAIDFGAFEGDYCNAAGTLQIRRDSPNSLQFVTSSAGSSDSLAMEHALRLVAARQNVFFPASRPPPSLPFLQFLGMRIDGRYEYIWNGSCLRRRADQL